MLKIRLTRLGAKKAPFYRIVVADSRAPREGRPVDTIGQYDATKQPAIVNVDEEKALAWLAKGAQPTDTEVYELHVAPEDMGKVIGKQGRIAKAIRAVVKAAAIKENKKISVDIV